ncbi:MAG: hypothetical protein ACKV2U_09790 [Bryobacteraceae bacterium]
MEYQFTGFTHNGEFREFAFNGIDEARNKTAFKVVADLSLSRKYNIAVQELPLLCRRLLEQMPEGSGPCTLTFSEADMKVLVTARAAAQRQNVHKKIQRRPKPVMSPWQQRAEPVPQV